MGHGGTVKREPKERSMSTVNKYPKRSNLDRAFASGCRKYCHCFAGKYIQLSWLRPRFCLASHQCWLVGWLVGLVSWFVPSSSTLQGHPICEGEGVRN